LDDERGDVPDSDPGDPEGQADDHGDQHRDQHGGRRRPSRRTLALLVTPIIVLVIASYVGDALTTTLAGSHPLVLTALNARNRILVLTTVRLDPVSYYVVATLRLLLSDPLFFVIGMLYGDAAVTWLEGKSPTYGRMLRQAERYFGKAAYPLVFIAPNNYICLLAGAAGMSIPAFVILNVTGTIARLYLIRAVGLTFEKPIDRVLQFFADYRWPLLALSVALVLFTVWNERRRGGGEIEVLREMEDELGEDMADDRGEQ
jgi:membrane protein DedA with SNARE-associated domain